MVKLVTLKPTWLNESEDDKYTHIGYGKYKKKGKEKDQNAPTFTKDDSGKYVSSNGDDAVKGGSGAAADAKPKVNIFDKPEDTATDEPKKDEPAKDSTNSRAGHPETNKFTRKLAQKSGITPTKLGREEYKKSMAQSAVAALIDSNFHDEARALVAKLENKPEFAKKPKYPDMSDTDYKKKMDVINKTTAFGSDYMKPSSDIDKFTTAITKQAGWDAEESIDAIAFDLKMNGSRELASTIQSIFEGKKSTKLTDLIK